MYNDTRVAAGTDARVHVHVVLARAAVVAGAAGTFIQLRLAVGAYSIIQDYIAS